MKVKVLEKFRDMNDHVTTYEKGTILEVQDEKRAQSLIDRQLAKEFKGNNKPAAILGPEPGGEVIPEEADTSGEGEGAE